MERLQLSRAARRAASEYWATLNRLSQWPRAYSDRNGLYEKNALGYAANGDFRPAEEPTLFGPGAYTLDNGAGGPDVSAFQTTLSIPATARR